MTVLIIEKKKICDLYQQIGYSESFPSVLKVVLRYLRYSILYVLSVEICIQYSGVIIHFITKSFLLFKCFISVYNGYVVLKKSLVLTLIIDSKFNQTYISGSPTNLIHPPIRIQPVMKIY